MARKLKLIPSTAEYANGIDFEMHFNPHTQRPDQRTHVDFKGTIKVLSVLTEIESCLLIRFFFLLPILRLDFRRLPGLVFDPPRKEGDECGLIFPNSGW